MNWTKEQQEAIEIRNKNILVSAAAGSGKTAVLVERIKQLIIRDQVPLDRMLIVTFSNAAASEMREKIVDAISKELEEESAPAADSQTQAGRSGRKTTFLREQLDLIHRASISTFHAFSMEVIRRYFYLIDIEPNFKICDEAQKTILQAEAVEELFSSMFESGSQDFIDFLSKFAMTKNDNAAKEMILEVHSFIQSIPDSFAWLRDRAEELACSREAFENSAAFREIRGEIARNLALAESCFSRAGELLEVQGIGSLIPKWKLDMQALADLRSGFETLTFDEFGALASGLKFQTYTAAKGEKEAYEEIRESVSALRDQGKSAVKKLAAQYFTRPLSAYVEDINRTYRDGLYLCFMVEEFDRIYREKKQGLIDFNDIEHYALALLSREEAAAEYRNKFEYIFIDEYQDSNIVQETLIGKIKRENNLFMVGDVKQSIYKFRLAEPEIFIAKYEAFKDSKSQRDIKLDLNRNFRSKGCIIAAVNDIFSRIMSRELSGLEYDEAAALYPGRPYEGELDYPVELQLVDDMRIDDLSVDDEIKEMKKAEVEAYTAAQIIRETRGKMIFDGKKGVERPVSNKDIVILLRSVKGYAEVYYEALMKEGIPAFVDTSDGYFDTLEIEVFLNLLRIIDNGKQDIPLLSVLRSSVFSFTVEELIRIRLLNKEGAYYRVFREYADRGENISLREKCAATLVRIEKWKKEAPLMPLEDFLWMLIRETGYYEFIGGIPGGSQRQANLRALVDRAVQFQSSQMKGLFSFINYIEAIKKRNVPMGQVKLLGENDDVVRIMTIHKSKGLEFPVVLVGGLGKRFNRDSGAWQVSLHKDIGLGIRYVDKENSCYKKTVIQTAIEQKKSREGLAEELRILYVAFTRAMDKLVLLGTMRDTDEALEKYDLRGEDFSSAKSYLDFLIPVLGNTRILLRRSDRRDISFSREETEQKRDNIRRLILGGGERERIPGAGQLSNEDAGQPSDEDWLDLTREIQRRLGYEYGHREALQLKSKFSVSELSRLAAEEAREEAASRAAERGRHRPEKMAPALDTPKFTREKNRFTGAEKGTILHKVMEQLNFARIFAVWEENTGHRAKEEAIRRVVDDLVEKELLTCEEAAVVSYEKIIGFFDSEIGRRACRADRLYKEVSFNIMKEMSGEKIIVQGTIDCYFEEAGKYVLLDYKSNYVGDPSDEGEIGRLTESYRMQLELYAEALEKIRGVRVEEAYLYLFALGKAVKVF
ncbi:MAG TPA: helicase-exonuclease AddAB subunit AddA [Bacillota bacterium]|nr:helicase-exonuclease AddAB subunit AddA [Bacillota bacterium]